MAAAAAIVGGTYIDFLKFKSNFNFVHDCFIIYANVRLLNILRQRRHIVVSTNFWALLQKKMALLVLFAVLFNSAPMKINLM